MTILSGFLAMFMVSCGTLSPEGKLQAAQKSFLASVKLLNDAKDAGQLKGTDLKKAQKIVKRVQASIGAWRHSILTDKSNGNAIQDRADLGRIVQEGLIQLSRYHMKKKKEPEQKKEEEDKIELKELL